MGKKTKIEWTHHTFNAWWGCEKVSPACTNCYAETFAKRLGLLIWGKDSSRRTFKDKHWNEPHLWDIEAKRAGERRRVFLNSMSDTFEDRRDLDPLRARLWQLIDQTSALDWLLLTKRPENIRGMVPPAWLKDPPPNVWYGTTVENQELAGKRIPALLDVPARVRFLSCEPLLGPVSLTEWIDCGYESGGPAGWIQTESPIHWVIAGGESGHGARPADPAWYRQLRDQAVRFGVPFHFKQWGEWLPVPIDYPGFNRDIDGVLLESKVDGKSYSPESLLVFANRVHVRVGKRAAGRVIDGRTWDEVPK